MRYTDDVIKIAITGKMRSGKSTVARILVNKYGFNRVSFAAPLKRYADDIFRFSPARYFDGSDDPFDIRKPRQLYQQFGELMREIDPLIWVRYAESLTEELADSRSTKGIVIDDLRQPHEEKWAKDNGFIIVRVSADEDDRIARMERAKDDFNPADLRHKTELYIDDIEADYEIWNDGDDKAELERKIDEIMSEIKKKGGW